MNAEQVRAAIAAAMQSHDADGMTSEEIKVALGVSLRATREALQSMIKAGAMVHAGHRTGYRIDGVRKRSPVYRLTEPSGADLA